jgi:hypothetical protein
MLFRILIILALAAVPFVLMLQGMGRRPDVAGGLAAPFNSGFERLCYFAMLLGLAILALTGLYAGLFLDKLTSYALMLHVSGAPLFALTLACLAVLWGDRHTLATFYRRRFPFWAMLFFGLLVILTGVLPMTPFFSAHPQSLLYETHRICGLLVLVFAIVHFIRLHQRA